MQLRRSIKHNALRALAGAWGKSITVLFILALIIALFSQFEVLIYRLVALIGVESPIVGTLTLGSMRLELSALSRLGGFDVLEGPQTVKFTFRMTEDEKREAAAFWTDFFRRAAGEAVRGRYDLLLLDELIGAVSLGMVPEEEVVRFLRTRPTNLETVLTGRDPSPALTELASYVSEIRAVKHPYTEGLAARRGVEF